MSAVVEMPRRGVSVHGPWVGLRLADSAFRQAKAEASSRTPHPAHPVSFGVRQLAAAFRLRECATPHVPCAQRLRVLAVASLVAKDTTRSTGSARRLRDLFSRKISPDERDEPRGTARKRLPSVDAWLLVDDNRNRNIEMVK